MIHVVGTSSPMSSFIPLLFVNVWDDELLLCRYQKPLQATTRMLIDEWDSHIDNVREKQSYMKDNSAACEVLYFIPSDDLRCFRHNTLRSRGKTRNGGELVNFAKEEDTTYHHFSSLGRHLGTFQ